MGPPLLSDLGDATGGVVGLADWTITGAYDLTAKGKANLSATLQEIYDQMKNFYELEIELPAAVDKPRRWKLDVVDDKGRKRKDVTVIYPQELVPCTLPRQ
jgi:hypothetical protein